MPRVYTIDGAKSGECKTVTNPRTGCRVKLCHTGRGRSGWTFVKGAQCPERKRRSR